MRRFALRVVAGLGLAVLACGDGRAPTAAPAPPQRGAALLLHGLLSCSPGTAATASATIGPEGGTIAAGPHALRVPPGALASAVVITARVHAGPFVAVDLHPDGLVFQQAATLTLSYAECGVVPGLQPKRIAYTSERLEILDVIPSIDNLLARRVTGQLDHFSTYAVAW